MLIILLPICFGLKKSVKGPFIVGLWSTSIVEKARSFACSLAVSGLRFVVGFLEVEAYTIYISKVLLSTKCIHHIYFV